MPEWFEILIDIARYSKFFNDLYGSMMVMNQAHAHWGPAMTTSCVLGCHRPHRLWPDPARAHRKFWQPFAGPSTLLGGHIHDRNALTLCRSVCVFRACCVLCCVVVVFVVCVQPSVQVCGRVSVWLLLLLLPEESAKVNSLFSGASAIAKQVKELKANESRINQRS